MKLNIILAQSKNGVIGANGSIPWHLPEDLARFKELTMGCPMIMGRKTWDTLPAKMKLLPGRSNLVVTRQTGWHEPCASGFGSLDEALQRCRNLKVEGNVWVIGGAEIYKQALPLAHRIELTTVDLIVEGDTFSPVFNRNDWQTEDFSNQVSANGIVFDLTSLVRRHPV